MNKTFFLISLLLFCFEIQNANSQEINSPATSIQAERFPRVLGFRNTEFALLRLSIFGEDDEGNLVPDTVGNGASIRIPRSEDEMVEDFKRFSVIGGKSLFEEKGGRMDRVRSAYNRVKDEQPGTTVLLHFNGRNRDPRYLINQELLEDEASPFFPGHYVLNAPIDPLDITFTEEEIAISLAADQLAQFVSNGSVNSDTYILIYENKADGSPDYYRSEYLLANGLDSLNRLTLDRDIYEFGKLNFNANKNISIAQIGNFQDKRLIYNFSNNAPLDSLGRNTTDVLSDEIFANFSEGGILEKYDGIILDAANVQDQYNQFGIGFENGVYLPIVGYIDFCRKIREKMGPEFIISADNRFARHQRAFQYLNGSESENWPQGQDSEFLQEWSSGIERHLFVASKVMEPRLDHFNTHSNIQNESRITEAAAAILGASHSSQYRMRLRDSLIVGYSDEMCNGKKFDFSGWLGKQTSEIINLAILNGEDVLSPQGIGDNLSFVPSTNTVETGLPSSEISIEGVEITDGEIYLEFDIEAARMDGYPADMPRMVWITAENTGESISATFENCKTPSFGGNTTSNQRYYIDSDGETIGMYLRWLNKNNLNISLSIEGLESATLKSMRAYSGPPVLIREFENGVVIANPAAHEVSLDLAAMFPGDTIRRIDGFFHPEINNGQIINDSLTIPCLDGLFLEKKSFVSSTLDKDELDNFSIEVYPNPTESEINILLKEGHTAYAVELFNASGQLVHSEKLKNSRQKSINISRLNSGIYILKVKVNGATRPIYSRVVKI